MTRQVAPRGPRGPRSGGGRDRGTGFGVGGLALVGRGSLVAPLVSAVGLLAVAMVTLGLFTGRLPFVPSRAGGIGGGGGSGATAAPSNVVIVDPKANVPGSIVYVKGGNVWIQTGTDVRQLTNSGHDAMPTWSADGQWIYYVETRTERGLFPYGGTAAYYDLTYPIVTRIHADGSGREELKNGKYTTASGRYEWFFWIRQPVPNRTGELLAVTSDGPDPTRNDVVLQLMNVATGAMTNLGLPEMAPLGHQDPAWRPVGREVLLYVLNARDGARGAPAIWRYDPKTKRSTALTGPGYMAPAWSPDGTYVAATRTSSLGTDVVILDLKTGSEVLRVTNDGRSWGPTWSPAGNSIAYLHMEGAIVDLRMVALKGSGPGWTVGDTLNLTENSGLDGGSRPDWFIPASQLPNPPPAGSPTSSSPTSSASASAGP